MLVIYNFISKTYLCVKKLNKTKILIITHSKNQACQSKKVKVVLFFKNELNLINIIN